MWVSSDRVTPLTRGLLLVPGVCITLSSLPALNLLKGREIAMPTAAASQHSSSPADTRPRSSSVAARH